MSEIKVMVTGACGKMGREVVKAVAAQQDMRLVAAVDRSMSGEDIGGICGIGELGVKVNPSLEGAVKEAKPDVMVDFTVAEAAEENISRAIAMGVKWVVGTTGMPRGTVDRLVRESTKAGVGGLLAPNFAIGAVLMMQMSKVAAKYMPDCEIIELHHDKKLDAPSGTAKATAAMVAEAGGRSRAHDTDEPPSRGGEFDGIKIHSVRLQGFVAHQEVIFGGLGQVLTIKHDSLGRESFMPGVILAVRKVMGLDGPVIGLEKVMGLDF
ncbi:MAG: 4-hydroxy-tetrahydrodipicolinate reductase [Firmicutes bacterium ADurb.Bin153]|nr:MAG: 4-hydroxy-tetrahydrodipicolinate reductase [Firmicutes bacterium ADurb.Bin153]